MCQVVFSRQKRQRAQGKRGRFPIDEDFESTRLAPLPAWTAVRSMTCISPCAPVGFQTFSTSLPQAAIGRFMERISAPRWPALGRSATDLFLQTRHSARRTRYRVWQISTPEPPLVSVCYSELGELKYLQKRAVPLTLHLLIFPTPLLDKAFSVLELQIGRSDFLWIALSQAIGEAPIPMNSSGGYLLKEFEGR